MGTPPVGASRGGVRHLEDLVPYDHDGVVRMRNCPFHAVAQRRPELVCDMNLALLRGLCGSGATARLEPAPGRCCVAIHRDWTERSAPS